MSRSNEVLKNFEAQDYVKLSTSDEPDVVVNGTVCTDNSHNKYIHCDDGVDYYPDRCDVITVEDNLKAKGNSNSEGETRYYFINRPDKRVEETNLSPEAKEIYFFMVRQLANENDSIQLGQHIYARFCIQCGNEPVIEEYKIKKAIENLVKEGFVGIL